MNEKIKNTITIILWILLFLFLCGYIVLAWELHEAKAYQRDVERIEQIDQQIKANSDQWKVKERMKEEEVKQVKAKREKEQAELNIENDKLRKEKEELQEKNIEPLGLTMRSQPQ